MGCFTKRSLNGWNFITAQLANNVTVSDLANTINYCSLTLDAPSSLMATSISISDINLSWMSNSDGSEGGFGIERSSDGLVFVQIDTVGVGITTYIDSGLLDGTKYYYQVRALGAIPSAYSNIADASTLYDFGLAMNFLGDAGGIADYVRIDSLFGEVMPVEHTLSFWMTYKNIARPNVSEHILISAGGGGMYWRLNTVGLVNEGTIKLEANATGGSTIVVSSAPALLLDGEPHFICIRRTDFDALNYNIDFIIDGVKSSGQILKSECLTAFKTTNISNSSNGMQNVTLDEFRFFPSLLSDEDISNYVNNKAYALFDALPTIFDHDFNTVGATEGGANGAYTTITDKSGNGHDGALNGFLLTGTTSNYVDSVE